MKINLIALFAVAILVTIAAHWVVSLSVCDDLGGILVMKASPGYVCIDPAAVIQLGK